MLVREWEAAVGNGMDEGADAGRVDSQLANLEPTVLKETLACFETRQGLQIRIVEFRDVFFQPLVQMYEDFEPKRGAQGLPPVGRDRLISWLRPLCLNHLNLLAFLGDRIIGHTMMCLMGPDRAEFAIFIHQGFRNQGIGSEFTRITLEYGKANRLRHIWLTVEVNNFSAIRVYKKMGFQMSGTYYPEVEMVLNLEGSWCNRPSQQKANPSSH
jgi:RimJ/RimL family protein N-acetyltransferase